MLKPYIETCVFGMPHVRIESLVFIKNVAVSRRPINKVTRNWALKRKYVYCSIKVKDY